MKLVNAIANGTLLYFNAQPSQLQVVENGHYRWLSFADIVQSLMLKRRPWQLTLPHQQAMMLPLWFFKPDNVVEFGLGGGNFARFVSYWAEQHNHHIDYCCVEKFESVITCFQRFFNPQQYAIACIQGDIDQWHATQDKAATWLLCDVFQVEQPSASMQGIWFDQQLFSQQLNANRLVSINLPLVTQLELQQLIVKLKGQLQQTHQAYCVELPAYCNIIIHLVPTSCVLQDSEKHRSNSLLSPILQHRFYRFWQLAKRVF